MQNVSEIGAPKLAQHVMETTGKNCHSETVRRILRKDGFHIGLEKETVNIHSESTKTYLNLPNIILINILNFEKRDVFADGSKCNIFVSDGKGKVGLYAMVYGTIAAVRTLKL